MSFKLLLTDDAARDLKELYGYIAMHDSTGKAETVLGRIEKTLKSLSISPERGVYPMELQALGIREYREIFFKPYRIIYRVIGEAVYIVLIADGRRNMRTLLQRRLLQV